MTGQKNQTAERKKERKAGSEITKKTGGAGAKFNLKKKAREAASGAKRVKKEGGGAGGLFTEDKDRKGRRKARSV
eukprot:833126-Pelagomonas_calceolata.AAC.15